MSEITKALIRFKKAAPSIIKDKMADVFSKRTGKEYHYTYAGLPEVMGAIDPILSECGLFLTQVFDKENGSTLLVTRIMHEAGELIASTIELPINGLTPQEGGSVITDYRRYSAVAIGGLAAGDEGGKVAQDAGAKHGSRMTAPQSGGTLKQQLK